MSLNAKGFTLVEVIASTAITGILLIVVMNFTSSSMVSISVESARADLLREAQMGLDSINRDIRLSATAEVNNRWQDQNAPYAPSDLLSWTSDDDTLILATAALNDDEEVLFQDPLQYITYKNNMIFFVKDGTLFKRTLAADIADNATSTSCPKAAATTDCLADRELINNVSSFHVRYLDSDNQEVTPANARSIELSIHLQTRRYGRLLSAEYLTRMVFRNE